MNSLSEHIRSLSQSSTTPQTLIDIAEDVQEMEAENARLRGALKEEPVAFEYQHEETGVIGYIDQWQIDNGFFKNNPRLQLIGPLYRHPPAREMSCD